MLKTFCFIYRKSNDADINTHYVRAAGWIQAATLARKTLGLTKGINWYCVPARRGLIRQYMNILADDYEGGCN